MDRPYLPPEDIQMPPIIEIFHSQMENHLEGDVLRACMKVGVEVDKPRLVQALTDARAFWREGYEAGRKESLRPKGEWEWFEEWLPSTPEHPAECEDCGWSCGKCRRALEDMVGGYWDDPTEKPQLHFCPNCGADMRGESDG